MDLMNNHYRKTLFATFSPNTSSSIFAGRDIDITYVEAFCEKYNSTHEDRISFMSVLVKAMGVIVSKELPNINYYIERGKAKPRKQLNVSIAVVRKKLGLVGTFKLINVHQETPQTLHRTYLRKLKSTMKKKEEAFNKNDYYLGNIPFPFNRFLVWGLRKMVSWYGFKMPQYDFSPDGVGSITISYIGQFDLDFGVGAIFPEFYISNALFLGRPQKKAVVIDDEIVIRKMMTFTLQGDHRILDGSHGGQLLKRIQYYLNHPEKVMSNE